LREFRRSSRFGLIGVLVVTAIVIAVALSVDSTDPNPKLQLIRRSWMTASSGRRSP
jgi:hypothetical protein